MRRVHCTRAPGNRWTVDAGSCTATLRGERGETLRLRALSASSAHVSFRQASLPAGGPPDAADRSWTLVDRDGDAPWQGLTADALPSSPLELDEGSGTLRLGGLEVRADEAGSNLRLRWFHRGAASAFAADSAFGAYAYLSGGESFHYMERHAGECVYGMGECTGGINKASPPRRYRLQATDALGYDAQSSDPTYKHTPFFVVYRPSDGVAYALLYDQLCGGVLDFGCEISAFRGDFRYYASANGRVDYVLVASAPGAAEPVADVVAKAGALLGAPALPPRWALGYLGSTMTYTDAPDAQRRLRAFGELCEAHGVPCSGFHLSSGYTLDDRGRRNVFTWDRTRVPEPAAMFRDFHERGMGVVPNVKPWLLEDSHPEYGALVGAGGTLKRDDNGDSAAAVGLFWQGGPGTFARGSYVDFTSTAGVAWWKARLTSELLALGADAAWNDNNEYEVDDDAVVTCAMDILLAGKERGEADATTGADSAIEQRAPVATVGRALQPLLMARASYDALAEHAPSKRPLVVSRSGCLGSHRYCAQTWSGDNPTSWHSLKWNVPMTLSLGLSGWIGGGFDVGGFAGGRPSAELLTRWVQLGVMMPRFSIHSCSWKEATEGGGAYSLDSTNSPWMFPRALPPIRDAIRWRCRLVPLLASLHLQAALGLSALPVVRPLALHFATDEDPRSRDESFEFTLGPSLLVAAVMEPDATTRETYLPGGGGGGGSGVSWCELHTGKWHSGGSTLLARAPLDRRFGAAAVDDGEGGEGAHTESVGVACCGSPLFLRGGAGLVLAGAAFRGSVHLGRDAREVLLAVPPRGGGGGAVCTWLEDDGASVEYRDGGWTRVVVRAIAEEGGDSVVVTEASASGGFALGFAEVTVSLPRGDGRKLVLGEGVSAPPDIVEEEEAAEAGGGGGGGARVRVALALLPEQ